MDLESEINDDDDDDDNNYLGTARDIGSRIWAFDW